MPLYDYVCTECGKCFEDVIQSVKDDNFTNAKQVGGCDCESGDGPIKRQVGKIMRMDLKGSGFYCNDYKRGYEVTKGKDGKSKY